ncbi:MAG: type II toxin-antitoxin system PemK/MazF family toxin [bacterium]|nr:type II toxin-antitoxin system PemK/MazF family toxin [bacterium]
MIVLVATTLSSYRRWHRPALVLSPQAYNNKSGLCVCCPITSKVKGYAFEVLLPEGLAVAGVVLADQVKSLDWQGRDAKFIDRVPDSVLKHVLAKLNSLLR